MKKKLLTVLLAVVMVFGVFGLTACGGKTNPDSDYNYYGIKYEIEDEVKIEAVTYQAVYRMMTTANKKFLLYVDSETGANTKANFQAINKFAHDYGIAKIYHFNPDLTGGYASNVSNAVTADLIKINKGEGEKVAIAQASTITTKVLANLRAITLADNAAFKGKDWDNVADANIISIKGVAPFWRTADGRDMKDANHADVGADAVITYGSYNATYKSWSGPIQGIQTVENAYKLLSGKFATQVASFAKYQTAEEKEAGAAPKDPKAYNCANINTIHLFADARLHMYDEVGDLTAEKTDRFVTLANYAMFAHLMDYNNGWFPVFFGGTWCPNTQAIAILCNNLAEDYGVEKIYFFDPKLDDGAKVDTATIGYRYNEDKGNEEFFAAVNVNGGNVGGDNTRDNDAAAGKTNYNFAYGSFLDNYLPTYVSQWNVGSKLSITVGTTTKDYTRMAVPNMMLFNGEDSDRAKLVTFAEAEYTWTGGDGGTSTPGASEYEEWTKGVKEMFDENPYAKYAPIMRATAEEEAPAASAPAAKPAAGGGDAC